MSMPEWDPREALGVRFADERLARAVRETALLDPAHVHTIKCFQYGIRRLDGIERLPNLLSVDLHMNEVSDGSPLAKLRRVEDLHLGLNACHDISFMRTMTSLKSVTLFDNDIEDCSAVKNLMNLEVLHLRFNQIDDVSPLANLSNLRELSLSSNLIEDLSPLARLNKVEIFNFYRNYVTDISVLAHMPRLREVYLGHNPIRDFSVLFSLQNLIEAKHEQTDAPQSHKDYLDQHVARNRARLGLPPM